MNKQRIYIVISTFHPIIGGAETAALLQGHKLRQKGFETTIVTFRFDNSWLEHEEMQGVPIIRIAGRFLGAREQLPRPLQQFLYLLALVVMGWRLWQWRQNYDILHVHQLTLLTLPTAMICRLTGKPMLVVVHSAASDQATKKPNARTLLAGSLDATAPWLRVSGNLWIGGDLADLERLGKPVVQFTRSLLEGIRAPVVVISSRMKNYLTQHQFQLSDVQLIPNGVDISRFTPIPSQIASLEQAQTVICISRLSYEKGIDVLLQAWYIVHKQRPEARLIIVGNGPLEMQFERMAKELGILDSVEFTGVQSDIVAQLHRGCLAVLPSRVEGMPIALLEAMACRLSCVATRVSGSEDIIEHGINGLLVEPENYQAMAAALITLLCNPDLAAKYGYQARLTVENYYTLEHVTDMYIELYCRMADRRQQMEEYTTA